MYFLSKIIENIFVKSQLFDAFCDQIFSENYWNLKLTYVKVVKQELLYST